MQYSVHALILLLVHMDKMTEDSSAYNSFGLIRGCIRTAVDFFLIHLYPDYEQLYKYSCTKLCTASFLYNLMALIRDGVCQ
jgi:hypothetical protein